MVGIESNQRPQKERKKRTGNTKIGKMKKKKSIWSSMTCGSDKAFEKGLSIGFGVGVCKIPFIGPYVRFFLDMMWPVPLFLGVLSNFCFWHFSIKRLLDHENDIFRRFRSISMPKMSCFKVYSWSELGPDTRSPSCSILKDLEMILTSFENFLDKRKVPTTTTRTTTLATLWPGLRRR